MEECTIFNFMNFEHLKKSCYIFDNYCTIMTNVTCQYKVTIRNICVFLSECCINQSYKNPKFERSNGHKKNT
jgi:hypothetical protein